MFGLPKSKSTAANPTSNTEPDIFENDETRYTGPVLNQDIIYLILEHAYFNNQLRPDYPNLSKYVSPQYNRGTTDTWADML